jgi:hypothetical protein
MRVNSHEERQSTRYGSEAVPVAELVGEECRQINGPNGRYESAGANEPSSQAEAQNDERHDFERRDAMQHDKAEETLRGHEAKTRLVCAKAGSKSPAGDMKASKDEQRRQAFAKLPVLVITEILCAASVRARSRAGRTMCKRIQPGDRRSSYNLKAGWVAAQASSVRSRRRYVERTTADTQGDGEMMHCGESEANEADQLRARHTTTCGDDRVVPVQGMGSRRCIDGGGLV